MRRPMVIGGSKQAEGAGGASAALLGLNGARITWTNPDPSLYDGVKIERNINSGGYTNLAFPLKGTTQYDDTPGYSLDVVYRLTTYKSGWPDGPPQVTGSVRTLPGTPSPQNLWATNPGLVNISALSPGHANIAGFDAALSTNGGSSYGSTVDTGSDPSHQFTGVGHWLSCNIRVRTRDGFGQTGNWIAWGSPVRSINDQAGPPAPTPTITQPNPLNGQTNNGRGFLVSWGAHADALSGNMNTWLQSSYDSGASWGVIYGSPIPGQADSFADWTQDPHRGDLVQYRLVTVDTLGNTTTGTATANYQTRPLGYFQVNPIESMTYGATGGWGYLGNDRCYGGVANAQENYGCWFYDAGIRNVCKGYVPDGCLIYLKKVSGISSSGNVYLVGHDNDGRQAGLPNMSDAWLQVNIGVDLIGSWIPDARLANLTGAYRGFAVVGNSQAFKALYGRNEEAYSGVLSIYFA